MFTKKASKTTTENVLSGSINIIGVGTSITGDLSCKGDVRVDGDIRGNVISHAKVVIGATGTINGDLMGTHADISGYIKGDITVLEALYLKSTARVEGDIVTNKLIVEAGAVFTGHCNMGVISEKLSGNSYHAGKKSRAKEAETSAS